MTDLLAPIVEGPIPSLPPSTRGRTPMSPAANDPALDAAREAGRRIRRRALLLWPRLDRRQLARTAGDPQRVARLVSRRTALPFEAIVAMLTAVRDLD